LYSTLFAELGETERALGQHALDGLLDDALGMLLEQVTQLGGLDAARVLGVAPVALVFELVARDAHLFRVDHDDVVAGVAVGRELGLVLATENHGDLGGQAAEGLVGGIHQDPVVPRRSCVQEYGFHRCLYCR
jgi:hypothetical protein